MKNFWYIDGSKMEIEKKINKIKRESEREEDFFQDIYEHKLDNIIII